MAERCQPARSFAVIRGRRASSPRVRAGDYPAIAEALPHARHDDDLEFEFGLDLVLDGLERARILESTR